MVCYERNVDTNARLEASGVEVIRVPGSELASGRGGPRAMSCPVTRDSAAAGAGVTSAIASVPDLITAPDAALAESIPDLAQAVAQAGAYARVIEAVPRALGREITAAVPAVTIGIGAGPGCDGQVLVMHDLLGLDPDWKPRFARRYAELGKAAVDAFGAYCADVRAGRFPADAESFE